MTYSDYSFLDYTVMPFLRKRVISADAAVLFSADLTNVLWANAIGTRMLGGDAVIDLLETGLPSGHALVRQLKNAAKQIEQDTPVFRSFRISRGLKTETIRGELTAVTLPNDSQAVLLVCPKTGEDRRYREHELAHLSVESLEGFADASAIIDEYGLILSSSEDFDAFEIDPGVLETLVKMVAREDDRLVKRPVATAAGENIAAGLGRIRDLPARFLVVLANPAEEAVPDNKELVQADKPESDLVAAIPPQQDLPDLQSEQEEHTTAAFSSPDNHGKEDTNTPSLRPEAGSVLDRWYFADEENTKSGGDDHNATEPSSEISSTQGKTQTSDLVGGTENADPTDENSRSTRRFAFTIDSERVVQSVSPELIDTVGIKSGNIIGQKWEDLARARGFDEDGVINKLLAKADTWSGKSVLWPVDQTDMVIPVDLAALPVFGKERSFDGFKGFGIIRSDDAIVDPQARGLSLASGEKTRSSVDPAMDDNDAESFGGWRADLSPENQPEESHVDSHPTQSGPDEAPSLKDNLDAIDEAEEENATKKGNIFHLPNFRTVPAKDQPPENTEYPSQDEAPGLNGKEKKAFREIRRNLTTNEAEAASAQAGPTSASTDSDPMGSGDSVLVKLPFPLLVYENGRTLFANDALLAETGYESLEALHAAGGIDALLANDEQSNHTLVRRRDGSAFEANSRLTKVDWQGDRALCLTFEAIDGKTETSGLTADTRQETALDIMRVSELQGILDTATDGLLIFDDEGMIESLNTSGEALFGVEQSEVVGKPFTRLFATECHETLEKQIAELRQPGVASILNQGHEVIGLEAKGGLIPLFVMIGKIGGSGRYCAVVRDLTEWKKTEEELIDAKRKAETASDQKSEFLSRVSHEIREPLTSIIGFSDVMIEERFGKIDNPRYQQYLKDINRSGVHVLDLVNDLLDISKIEAGKLELSYEAVDLNKLAAETVALLQPKANKKRIIIRTSLSRAVPKVVADARTIRQIIMNMVSNAIQYSDRNSQVIVSTTFEENGEVALRIRDTGYGMTKSELRRALEPFGQVGADRIPGKAGTGLGLPLTKALVEANRAYFELESTKGEGTIAHIQFPSQRVLAD